MCEVVLAGFSDMLSKSRYRCVSISCAVMCLQIDWTWSIECLVHSNGRGLQQHGLLLRRFRTPCDAIGLVIERRLSVRQVHVRDVRSSVLDQFSLFDRPRARGVEAVS
jgi:hypothetical protein